jgi:hypothetical protein
MAEVSKKGRRKIDRFLHETGSLTPEETAVAAGEFITIAGFGRDVAEAFIEGLVTERSDDNALEFINHLRSVASGKWPDQA